MQTLIATARTPLQRSRASRLTSPGPVLFACLFAAQAAILVLSPILLSVARAFDVSPVLAGQLRTISGLVAGVTALMLARALRRYSLRDLLLVGAVLLTVGCLMSALAPAFFVLVLAQVPIGVALAILISGGVAGVAEWVASGERTRVLSRTLVGQPAAWILGMPVIGALGELSWRLAFIAVPLVSSLVAAAAVSARPRGRAEGGRGTPLPQMLREPLVAAWALGELLAYSAWTGVLVYAGALFIDSYGTSLTLTGILLSTAAAAYVLGNFALRRLVDDRSRVLLVSLALAAALGTVLFGVLRDGIVASALVFGVLAFLSGGRTLVGSAIGLGAARHCRLTLMGVRTATVQFGYLCGSALGGLALAIGGYEALGAVLGVLFAAAAVPHLVLAATGRGRDPGPASCLRPSPQPEA
jgi:predicted MFS family arabinose efflux permease